MNVNKNLDKFINSPALSTSIFLASGGYRTYTDYKNAEGKYKKKFLIKDSFVLSGAAAGILLNQAVSKKIQNNSVFKKAIHNFSEKLYKHNFIQKINTPIEYTKEILKDFSANFLLFTSGILGALGADYALSKTGFEQPEAKVVQNELENNKISQYIDSNMNKVMNEEVKDAVYSRVTDMPQMHIFTTSLIGTQAMNLAKEREADKRLKHTTKCLINDSLVPLMFLSISGILTKKMKSVYRVPIIFTSLVGGTMITQKLLNKYIKNFSDD